jgi:hypothetical protein
VLIYGFCIVSSMGAEDVEKDFPESPAKRAPSSRQSQGLSAGNVSGRKADGGLAGPFVSAAFVVGWCL